MFVNVVFVVDDMRQGSLELFCWSR